MEKTINRSVPEWVNYLDHSCCRELDHSCWRYLNRSGRRNLDFSSWRDLARIWWWDQKSSTAAIREHDRNRKADLDGSQCLDLILAGGGT